MESLTLRELEIIKAALESDIHYQIENKNVSKEEFKLWLEDTKKLLKKVTRKLSVERAKESYKVQSK